MGQHVLTGAAQSVSTCDLQGPIGDGVLGMDIYGGENFRWKVVFPRDQYQIEAITPASDSLTFNSPTCFKAGDCLKIWCHKEGCSDQLINGEHQVLSVSADKKTIVLNTDLAALGADQSFVAVPVVPGCTTTAVSPPTAALLRDISGVSFKGRITNRLPGDRTRLAMAANVTQGSPIVQPQERGDIQVGDVVNIPAAGITGAKVLEKYTERGLEYLRLNQSSTASGCQALSSQVGVIADFSFERGAPCGSAIVTLDSLNTDNLPLAGQRVMPMRGSLDVSPYYELGIYSIFAQYLDDQMRLESELIARGPVRYRPSNY